jgi:hypothetical protein
MNYAVSLWRVMMMTRDKMANPEQNKSVIEATTRNLSIEKVELWYGRRMIFVMYDKATMLNYPDKSYMAMYPQLLRMIKSVSSA